jgi:holo-[acyl-carrier protein] synthase
MSMLGIGIDAVDIDRFRRALKRTPSLRSRVFTSDEIATLANKRDDASSLAARFAAREATMKVLGVGLGAFDLHDVSIERLESGQPLLRVTGRAQLLANERGITSWHVSLSHTDSVAIAVVAAA